jgi:hypothetical protein
VYKINVNILRMVDRNATLHDTWTACEAVTALAVTLHSIVSDGEKNHLRTKAIMRQAVIR